MRMQIGEFLVRRLKEMGVHHLFGVPGDFNLSFLEQVEADSTVQFIGNCNELNAAYAADGYARTSGIAGLVTTFGVGDLGAIGGIAGAYAERVPLVHITGIPPFYAVNDRALLHHTLADGAYGNIGRCMAEYTVAQCRLTPDNAVFEIDRVLRTCWIERRPVHIQIASDLTHLEIETPDEALLLSERTGDIRQIQSAAEHILERVKAASTPVLIVDADVDRFGCAKLVERLAERCSIPCLCVAPGKAVLNENSPYFLGGYMGKASRPDIYHYVAESDCMIGLGLRMTDVSSGFFTHRFPDQSWIDIRADGVVCGERSMPGVPMKALLEQMLRKSSLSGRGFPCKPSPSIPVMAPSERILNHAELWPRMAQFFKEDDVIIGEAGTSNTGLMSITMPVGTTYISQPIWGAIGYTLPALFGSLMGASSRRHILFIGDGSVQLTVQELSSILRYNQKPIIFLLNNGGYTIERLILGDASAYNDIADWRYSELPRVFDKEDKAFSCVVRTFGELEEAFIKAEKGDQACFIELQLPPMDAPEALKKFGAVVADYDYGECGPRNG